MPPLLLKLYFGRMGAPMAARADGQIAAWLATVETALAAAPFLAGTELSVADIMMSFPLEAVFARGPDMASFPRVAAYLDRLQARPAYARALDRGGPYTILK